MVKKNSENTKKKSKKEKIEGEPKKNKSSYLFFCETEREKVLKDIPGISFKDIMSELGKRWKAIKDTDKVKFEELAVKDKERYIKEKQEFESNKSGDSDDTGELVPDIKTKSVTKKNKTNGEEKSEKKTRVNGYINYCSKHRAEYKLKNPDVQPKDITRALAGEWKLLSEEEKESYKY